MRFPLRSLWGPALRVLKVVKSLWSASWFHRLLVWGGP
ncbi:hypothetical protein TSC_c16160 [Thermus scotoductus SA-01]|uniref:Uncharacterized protein n=1 Tax=Thermus scotoductus (strain ATCC 700910 / SA-01) TaxID=743525 RepID=E8PL07_THESS|nr:hypothetical protein TSC_c16160 [Thermus scotoductus SA-01]